MVKIVEIEFNEMVAWLLSFVLPWSLKSFQARSRNETPPNQNQWSIQIMDKSLGSAQLLLRCKFWPGHRDRPVSTGHGLAKLCISGLEHLWVLKLLNLHPG